MENPSLTLIGLIRVSSKLSSLVFFVRSKQVLEPVDTSSTVVGIVKSELWQRRSWWQCIVSWLLRSVQVAKNLAHNVHSIGWSVWVIMWVLRLDLWLKALLQIGHLWGDSSICRILCTASVRDWQKPLPHSEHLNGFSLLCIYLERQTILRKIGKQITQHYIRDFFLIINLMTKFD